MAVIGLLTAALAAGIVYVAREQLTSRGLQDSCRRESRILELVATIDPFTSYNEEALADALGREVSPLRRDADLIADKRPRASRMLRQQATHVEALAQALQTDPGTPQLPSEQVRQLKRGIELTAAQLHPCPPELRD